MANNGEGAASIIVQAEVFGKALAQGYFVALGGE